MSLERHTQDWERLAEADALWAVLTVPGRRGGGWDVDEFFATGEAEVDHVLDVAASLGLPAGRERALDFGCGVGRLTRALAGRFETATGVDISTRMIEQARLLNESVPAARFEVNAAVDLARFDAASFDLVYSGIVLQHLPSVADIERYVREFLRVVRPDGIVVFGIPCHIPLPWSLQPRRRAYALLRRVGVSESWLLRRTPLTPMRMTVVPETPVRRLLDEAGARLLQTEPIDQRPVRSLRYYASAR